MGDQPQDFFDFVPQQRSRLVAQTIRSRVNSKRSRQVAARGRGRPICHNGDFRFCLGQGIVSPHRDVFANILQNIVLGQGIRKRR